MVSQSSHLVHRSLHSSTSPHLASTIEHGRETISRHSQGENLHLHQHLRRVLWTRSLQPRKVSEAKVTDNSNDSGVLGTRTILLSFCFESQVDTDTEVEIEDASYIFSKHYGISKVQYSLMSMKLQNIFLHLLAFKFLSEQAKNMFLQIFYSRFGAEFTFELWWTHYMLEELGNNITDMLE